MARGRLEARITFTSDQTGSWTDANGGPLTWTVAAGNYYPTELCAALQAAIVALAGSVGFGATVTLSNGESGTGLVTINGAANWALGWVSTPIRDILGFTGDIALRGSALAGTNHCMGLWIPDSPSKYTKHGDSDNGRLVTDFVQTISSDGAVKSLGGGRGYRVHERILWDGVSGAKAKTHLETTTHASFETWWLQTQLQRGSVTLWPRNSLVRLYWNADSASYVEGRLVGHDTFDPDRFIEGWTGRYRISCPDLVVPS